MRRNKIDLRGGKRGEGGGRERGPGRGGEGWATTPKNPISADIWGGPFFFFFRV